MKPTLLLTAFGIALVSLPSYAETPVYAALFQPAQTQYWQQMESGIKQGIKDIEADYYTLPFNPDLPDHSIVEICMAMLQRKPNALLLPPATTPELSPCIQKAHALNIAVISIAQTREEELADTTESDSLIAVRLDDEAAGELSANYLLEQADMSGAGKILIVDSPKSPGAEKRAGGVVNQLAKQSPTTKIVFADNSGDQQTTIASAIDQHADVRGIVLINDHEANYVNEEFTAPDSDTRIPVVGIGGSAAAIKAVRDGHLDATVTSLPYSLGKSAVINTLAILSGDHPKSVLVEPALVNLKVIDSGSFPLPVPPPTDASQKK